MPNRKPNFDFFQMGLRVGDRLHLVEDPNICVKIVNNKRVQFYRDIPRSLSSMTEFLLQRSTSGPCDHWQTKDGTILSELYAIHMAQTG